jgi:predicted RNA-binding Zn-ribbon protein involved in translation (DUF1610 family)
MPLREKIMQCVFCLNKAERIATDSEAKAMVLWCPNCGTLTIHKPGSIEIKMPNVLELTNGATSEQNTIRTMLDECKKDAAELKKQMDKTARQLREVDIEHGNPVG